MGITTSVAADNNVSPGKLLNKPVGRTIVIPVDESRQSELAFDWYVQFAHKEGNVVRIINVHNTTLSQKLMPDIKGDKGKGEYESRMDCSSMVVERYNNKMKQNNVSGSVHIEMGKPGEKILAYSGKVRANQIVMGCRGFGVNGMIKRAFIGGVTQHVVNNSTIPVTVVPRETRRFLFS